MTNLHHSLRQFSPYRAGNEQTGNCSLLPRTGSVLLGHAIRDEGNRAEQSKVPTCWEAMKTSRPLLKHCSPRASLDFVGEEGPFGGKVKEKGLSLTFICMLAWSQNERRNSNRGWKSKPEVPEAQKIV